MGANDMAKSYRFYDFFAEAAEGIDNEDYGILMRAINEYVFMGKKPDYLLGFLKVMFTLMKPYLDKGISDDNGQGA